MTTLYCARWIVPISVDPIADGAIAVEGDLVSAVGDRSSLLPRFSGSHVVDLGDAAILPGFVNAHSHLELTAMRGYLEREESDFFAWLKKLTIARLELMTADDLYVSAAWGACEAARAGVTSLGDASDTAIKSMKALRDVGLRATVYQESFGPDPRLAEENFAKLREKVSALRAYETPLVRVGVSPHAPYTVCAPQLRLIANFATEEKLPLMMHAAESAAEDLFLREGRGPFAEALAKRGIEWHAPGISTIQYLQRHGVLQTRTLLAHCINVDERDIETIKTCDARIAHCPKSNAKLGQGRAPFAAFVNQGIAIGLGSDSVASNNSCDILEEARFATLLARAGAPLEHNRNFVSASTALFAATLGGARALGLEGQVGELRAGLQADLAAVSLKGVHQLPGYDPVSTLVFASSARDVVMTVVAGREVFRDGRVTTIDEDRLRARVNEIANKLQS